MEDLSINVGMSLNMQLLLGESTRRHDVQVIGYMKGDSVLVTMPTENGVLARIAPKDEYIVRYFKGRNIFAFKTKILYIATTPFNYIHIDYPKKLEKVEVRQAERIQISIKAQILVHGQTHWSEIRDISAGGAQVIVNSEIGNKGDKIEIFFDLKIGDIEREIHLMASIHNAHESMDKNKGKPEYRYGVEFLDPTELDVVFVQGFVYEQLLNNRDSGSGHN